MASYQSPGVYVEEVSSGMKPIAGVGTSTAAFIGELPDQLFRPLTEEEKEEEKKKKTGGDETTDTEEGSAESPTPRVLSPANSNNRSGKEVDLPREGEPKLCTNFSEFIKEFGDFDVFDESSAQSKKKTTHGGHNTYVPQVDK